MANPYGYTNYGGQPPAYDPSNSTSAYPTAGFSGSYTQQAPPQSYQQHPPTQPYHQPPDQQTSRQLPQLSNLLGHSPAKQPFTHLCAPNTNLITLNIYDKNGKTDLLLAPGATNSQPLYTIVYKTKSTLRSIATVKVSYHGTGSSKTSKAGKVEVKSGSDHKASFKFPWLKWGITPFNDEEWLSDVGTLDKHSLVWKFLGAYGDGFVLQCFDIDDAYAPVCKIIMDNYYDGKIEILGNLIKDQKALDEMIVVAMGVLTVQRNSMEAPERENESDSSGSSSSDSN